MTSSTSHTRSGTLALNSEASAQRAPVARTVELLPFYNEVDVLLARVALMAGHIDRHLVCEGTHTHQGDPKPLYLDGVDLPASVKRYKLVMRPGDGESLNWRREQCQRDCLANWIRDLDPDTLVLSCDCDEIVDPHALDRIREAAQHGPVSLDMRMIYYGNREQPDRWPAAKAFLARDMPDSLSALRLAGTPRIVPDTGWHLSYLGDVDRRRRKVEAFAHAENRPGTPAWDRVAAGEQGPNGEHLVPFDPTELPPILQTLITEVRP